MKYLAPLFLITLLFVGAFVFGWEFFGYACTGLTILLLGFVTGVACGDNPRGFL